jgi:hypothetical protein
MVAQAKVAEYEYQQALHQERLNQSNVKDSLLE